MTYIKAIEIKADFTVAIQFADYSGKSQREAFAEPAKRYSKEELAEAYAALCLALDKEKRVLEAMFTLAIKSKIDTEEVRQ
jgi:hypothetical protein